MAVIAKQRYKLDIAPKGGWVIVYASQHDNAAREIEFEITNQGKVFDIPANINVSVQGVKSNGGYFTHNCTYSGNVVTMALADDMTDVIGKAICVLKFTNASEEKLATAKFILNVDSDSSSEGVIVDTEAEEIFNQMLDEIRAQAASVSADIAELQSMVGSPLVASTVSAMTDHNKIYVYTGSESGYTNGNWYYWNGSAWTSGGVYNSVAINIDSTPTQGSNNTVSSGGVKSALDGLQAQIPQIDATLTQSGQAADAKFVGGGFLYQTVYPDIVKNNGVATVVPSYVNRSVKTGNGEISGVAANRIANDILIYIPDGAAFSVTINDSTNYYLPSRFCFDKNKTFIGHVQTSDGAVADGTVYVRLLVTRRDNGNLTPEDAQSVVTVTLTKQTAHAEIQELENGLPMMIEQAMFETGFNKFNPDDTVAGFIMNNAGAINPGGSYFTSDFIDVSNFQHGYAFTPNARKILFYDANKTAITESYHSDETAAGVIQLNFDYKYIRLSWYSTSTNIVVADAATLPSYVPYEIVAKGGVNYLNEDTKAKIQQMIGTGGKSTDITSFLNGKTIAVFGDSIMYGAGSNAKGAVDLLAEKYGMIVNKYCVSGSTMGIRTDDPQYTVNEVHHIAKQVRNAIAASINPDIIVFNGGTNDIGGQIPIGTMTAVYTEPQSESYFADGFETVAYLLKKNFVGVPIIYMRAHNMSSRSYTGQIEYGELGNGIAEKWGICVIDMYKRMNTQLDEYRTIYLADYTHPNTDGYNKYYIPALEDFIFRELV